MKVVLVSFVLISVQIAFVLGHVLLTPLFNTKYGPVYGTVEFARYGRPFYSFKGIPYAKPPINDLRFKAPEEPEQWSEPWDATRDGPVCIQKNYLFANPTTEGQEDCLYINVYTPNGDINYQRRLLPVMVFIHWGGFFAGRGTADYLGPKFFMQKNVVLVTFNYRLGVFGFLTTLDDAAPGNYALKDQVAALKWVQDNIHYFGGDKSKVTIFGQSAGAASVHLHMISPLSKGLFRGAISQSGSALALWATPSNVVQESVIAAQAKFVNCDNYLGDSPKLVGCLRNVSAELLMETQDLFKTFFVDPLTVYTIVTETPTEANPRPFITKMPIEYIQAKEFMNVPWIIGVVQDEGILKVGGLLRQTDVRNSLNSNFVTIVPSLLYFSTSTGDAENLYSNVTKMYLQNKEYINITDAKSVQGFIDLYSDRSFAYSSYQSAVVHALRGHRPIWFYNFDYRGMYTYGDYFASTTETIDFPWGVSHCDELLYLFNSPGLFPPLFGRSDVDMSNMMINIWTNFAIYGEPNPPHNPTLGWLKWKPLDIKESDKDKNEKLCFLNVTGSYEDYSYMWIKCGFNPERISFWANQNLLENIEGLT